MFCRFAQDYWANLQNIKIEQVDNGHREENVDDEEVDKKKIYQCEERIGWNQDQQNDNSLLNQNLQRSKQNLQFLVEQLLNHCMENKVSLTDLIHIRTFPIEMDNDCLHGFWQVRSRCFLKWPKNEMVKTTMINFNFSIRKRLAN